MAIGRQAFASCATTPQPERLSTRAHACHHPEPYSTAPCLRRTAGSTGCPLVPILGRRPRAHVKRVPRQCHWPTRTAFAACANTLGKDSHCSDVIALWAGAKAAWIALARARQPFAHRHQRDAAIARGQHPACQRCSEANPVIAYVLLFTAAPGAELTRLVGTPYRSRCQQVDRAMRSQV